MKQPCIYIATHDFSTLLAQGVSLADKLHPADLLPLASHPKRRFIQQFSRYYRRQLLAKALQQPEHSLLFSQTEYGKPVLPNQPQFGFNQSHSNVMYALAWSHDIAHIGIDIEDKNRVMRVEELARHSLTALEYERFQQAADQQYYWLKVWTIKEAVLKASGLGIRLSLNELETDCLNVQQQTGIVVHPKIGQWCYACYELDQHLLSVSWQWDGQQNVKNMFSAEYPFKL